MKKVGKLFSAALLAPVLATPASRADTTGVTFTFQRHDDGRAILTGSGRPDTRPEEGFTDFPYKGLEFKGAFGQVPFAAGPVNGQVAVTTATGFSFGEATGATWGAREGDLIDSFARFADDSTPTGSLILSVTDGNDIFFREIGSSGAVLATFVNLTGVETREEIGTWDMIAPVSFRGALSLIAAPLAFGGFAAQRGRGSAQSGRPR